MSRALFTTLGLYLFALGSGCIFYFPTRGPKVETGETGTICTEIAVSSVVVSVVDPSGNPTVAESVSWSVDGSAPQPAECLEEPCTEWIAGWEVTGEVTVTGRYYEVLEDTACWAEDEDTQTVTVPLDEEGCHPVTQHVTLVLDPSILVCPEE